MAVLVEAISVVIKTDALLRAFGSLGRFQFSVPNETYCTDGELARAGFMHPDDVRDFVTRLEARGLQYQVEGQSQDLVVIDQQVGFLAPCDWAAFGRVGWQGDSAKRIGACMLNGSSFTQVEVPNGWMYEGSLSQSFGFIPNGNEDSLDLVETREGVEVYQSPLSEKPMYVARTSSSEQAEQAKPKMGRFRLPWIKGES